jgi:uncharacterized DUF497 family protein
LGGFEWDADKAAANFKKHGVTFTEGATALDDPNALELIDNDSDPYEERFVVFGISNKGRVLAVTYTLRGKNIRIISARKATANEDRIYFEQ